MYYESDITNAKTQASPRGRARRALALFGRDEDGSLIIFGLFMFVALLIVGGLAVDIMRYETMRARLQSTVDRAVLAAASLSQPLDAEEVVRDYFTKANLIQYLDGVEVDEGLNYRTVTAETSAVMPALFLRLVGIDTLTAPAAGTAEERINNVEVSLVLDLSGSMNSYGRLDNLKAAGRDFVDTLLGDSEEDTISISMIPYTGQVNAGETLLSEYNVQYVQDFSHCVDFSAGEYTTTALPPGNGVLGAGHGFAFATPEYSYYDSDDPTPDFYNCPIPPENAGLDIMPFQRDADYIKGRIDAMEALGATSIDIGMKWGTALLDPQTQPAISDLVDAGEIVGDFDGRPFDFDEPETMKVVVLMTDGANFAERRFSDSIKTGPSNVWINTEDDSNDTFSLYDPSTEQYWWRADGNWHDAPYGREAQEICEWVWSRWGWRQECTMTSGDTDRQLTYPELWDRATTYWVARHIHAEAHANYYRDYYASNLIDNWQTEISPAEKDRRLADICAAARSEGIIVFSVAFEAARGGREALQDCASSPAHYFDVAGLEVRDAFRAIARQISQLRLVQ